MHVLGLLQAGDNRALVYIGNMAQAPLEKGVSGLTSKRRDFLAVLGFGFSAHALGASSGKSSFRLRYALASCLYGCMDLETVLAQVRLVGATHIDLWPRPHGNQREQLDEIGEHAFKELLSRHNVKLGILSRYDKGPFRLKEEIGVAQRLGASLIVTGSGRPAGGSDLKKRIRAFVEKLKPTLEAAEAAGVTIGIENHSRSLIDSPDSIRLLGELSPSRHLGVALAPYHLPQDPKLIAGLIRGLRGKLVHFYAWQHGKGCMRKLPKEEELLQLPGRGPLDFKPILQALKDINYKRWTEIFMHPVPRGIPILPTARAVTEEINRARRYLDALCRTLD